VSIGGAVKSAHDDNRPPMNANFLAGNNASDGRDGTRALDNSSATRRSVQHAASQTFTAMKCL